MLIKLRIGNREYSFEPNYERENGDCHRHLLFLALYLTLLAFSSATFDLSPWRVEYARFPTNQMIRLTDCIYRAPPQPPVAASTEWRHCTRLIPSSSVVTKEIEDSMEGQKMTQIISFVSFSISLSFRYKLEYQHAGSPREIPDPEHGRWKMFTISPEKSDEKKRSSAIDRSLLPQK